MKYFRARAASCLAHLLAAAAAAAPVTAEDAIVIPQGTGPYRSSLMISALVDDSRPDPFNASHVRRIMVSRFEPVSRDCHLVQVPYFPPVTAALESEILGSYEYPKGNLDRFVLEMCEADKQGYPKEGKYGSGSGGAGGGKGKFPLAIYSPGLNTTRLFGSLIAQELASHGLTVITVDHPYDVDIVEFPNGDIIFGGRVEKPTANSSASVEHALEVRSQDVSFLLDTLGIEQGDDVVMFGQSFGGAATATSMFNDRRIRAGVNIDGIMFGPVLHAPLGSASRNQSFVLWGSELHLTDEDETWNTFWNALESSEYVDYKKEFAVKNTTHGSYWDLDALVDVAGIRDELTELATYLVGPGPGLRHSEIVGKYLSSFFLFALGKQPEDPILQEPSEEFPEVVLMRS
ncbi:hypothetical protein BU24DRAFT_417339 [Aaosphaeria arxii CBS 175.79]|uniref:1-alkyl-2-acetylglycerophosphocholine esterase n=1 Tax=Aaosphaeria arxii CBS 175.79 TaxID=1450172 RepID=A0A6A5Y7Z5_9PLEO|nr:uncharacterized protein BU24DRAFT_417339 [Aaosphaeria arxii CBS 175.79]KAF2021705.1 hypothetical protein BU24DRAFT_417339 [Aaosphaeria arxii CBS 175.79]